MRSNIGKGDEAGKGIKKEGKKMKRTLERDYSD